MPPKLTPEERIQSDLKRSAYAKAWRLANKEKFDTYMQGYYLEHKKEVNQKRTINARKQRERNNAKNAVIPVP
jgi:hypothetical protein